jgi:hypothetical protein
MISQGESYNLLFMAVLVASLVSCGPGDSDSVAKSNDSDSANYEMENAKKLTTNFIKSEFNNERDVNYVLNIKDFYQSDFMVIANNEDGEIQIADQKKLSRIDQIAGHIRNFYRINEPLASIGINREYLIDEYYPAFERLCKKDVEHRMKVLQSSESKKLTAKELTDFDDVFKLLHLEDVFKGMKSIDLDCISVMSESAHIILNYQNGTHGIFIEDIYAKLAQIIYELRNEKSLKFFQKPYCEIYWDFVRNKTNTGEQQLKLLSVLIPARVLDVQLNDLQRLFKSPPELVTPPHPEVNGSIPIEETSYVIEQSALEVIPPH